MTDTLICPGYSISSWIFLAMSLQIRNVRLSSSSLALTMTRTSRPACRANALVTPVKGLAQLLQFFQPLDVGFQDFAPGAGTGGGNAVGGLDQDGLDGVEFGVHVVRSDGVLHGGRLAVLLGQIHRERRMRALGFAVDGLADIVQQAGALAMLTLAPISRASMAAIKATSLECSSTFWPNEERNFSLPR